MVTNILCIAVLSAHARVLPCAHALFITGRPSSGSSTNLGSKKEVLPVVEVLR